MRAKRATFFVVEFSRQRSTLKSIKLWTIETSIVFTVLTSLAIFGGEIQMRQFLYRVYEVH